MLYNAFKGIEVLISKTFGDELVVPAKNLINNIIVMKHQFANSEDMSRDVLLLLLEDMKSKCGTNMVPSEELMRVASGIAHREWVIKIMTFHIVVALSIILDYSSKLLEQYVNGEIMYSPLISQYNEPNSMVVSAIDRPVHVREHEVNRIANSIAIHNAIIIQGSTGIGKRTMILALIKQIILGKFPLLHNSTVMLNPKKEAVSRHIGEQIGSHVICVITGENPEFVSPNTPTISGISLTRRVRFVYIINTDKQEKHEKAARLVAGETIDIEPTNKEETIKILEASTKELKEYVDFKIDPASYGYIYDATDRFDAKSNQPTKSVNLLTEVVFNKLNQTITGSGPAESTPDSIAQSSTKETKSTAKRLRMNTAMRNIKVATTELDISMQDIEQFVVERFQLTKEVLASMLSTNVRDHLKDLESKMLDKVYGQDEAVSHIVKSLWRRALKIDPMARPVSFMLIGPTGIGKTYAARILSELLQGSQSKIQRYDMSEYMERHEVSKLIGCFVPGSKNTLTNGFSKNIESMSVGNKIITAQGNIKTVLDTYAYKYDGEIYALDIVNVPVLLRSTPTHEYLMIRTKTCHRQASNRICKPSCSSKTCKNRLYESYELEYAEAKHIKVGDYALIPRLKTSTNHIVYLKSLIRKLDTDEDKETIYVKHPKRKDQKNKINKEIKLTRDSAKLFGLYVTDGGEDGNGKCIKFTYHSHDTHIANETNRLMKSVFGTKSVTFRTPPAEKLIGKKRINGTYCSQILAQSFKTLFGSRPENKHLPEWFIHLPNHILLGFLEGIILGDGSLKQPNKITYKTVSIQLANQISIILSKLGIIANLQISKPKYAKWKDIYVFSIQGRQMENIKQEFTTEKILEETVRNRYQRMSFLLNDYIAVQVNNVSKSYYNGIVHDISVKDDTSYTIENIAVHNSPPGYIGSNQPGRLTETVIKNPYAIILLDEIEKAHEDILNIFLQVLDDGRLTDNHGRTADFTKTIIFMTSNVGCKDAYISKGTIGFNDGISLKDSNDERRREIILQKARDTFKPEFINRIGKLIVMNSLSDNVFKRIILTKLAEISEHAIINIGYAKRIEETILTIAKRSEYDINKYNAREVQRVVTEHVENSIVDFVAENDCKDIIIKTKGTGDKVCILVERRA